MIFKRLVIFILLSIYIMWKEISRETRLVIGWNITTSIWEFRTKDLTLEVELRNARTLQAFIRKKWSSDNFVSFSFDPDTKIEYAIKDVENYLNDNFKIID